ncbi:MAG: DUF6247 family protein [Sciscionella sp.]
MRDALLSADVAAFDTAYAAARTSLDLTELFTTLGHWRRVAVPQRDPEDYWRVVRHAAELLTGGNGSRRRAVDGHPRQGRHVGVPVYRVTTDEQAQHQIDALPADALPLFAECGPYWKSRRGAVTR